MRRGLAVLLFAVLSLAARAEELDVTVVTLEGAEKAGKLTGLTADAFQLEQGNVSVKEVAEVRFAGGESQAGTTTIMLRNGDQLKAAITGGDDTKLKLKSLALGDLELENNFVDGMTFAIKDGPAADVVDSFMKAAPPKEDQLLLPKGDTLSGFMEKFSDKEISFNVGGQSRPYPFEKIAAFRFAPLKDFAAAAGFRATLNLRDSSQLSGKLTGLDGKALTFEGIDGKQWKVPASELKSIVFAGGKLVYLSDVKPANVEQKPYVGGMPVIYGWRRDQSVLGEKMTLGGKPVGRGIGVHSFCKLTYNLDGKFAKLLCDVGLDGAAPASAVATWKVVADGKELASGTAKAGDGAHPIKVELTDAKQLELICDYGPDDDDAGDYLDWANARLIKP